ncbi:MAG: hypothetical protein C0601_11670 [Candidatus Muiribacterium halophilum]|uniref:Clathrin/coatomer adaptor adaptin-like N-terminal domain-containing protein n=1 Tax=Muiribacterium halophilum TaxID=2053465 RepID=A0A2N5ZBF0_MUIH1|nr:MAG: hypothetical protein C0601_11670 [Candidatus Muirbacterium halophilum]
MVDLQELVFQLNSRNLHEKLEAIKQMGESDDPNAIEYLLNSLPELRSEVRLAVIRALGNLKDKRASGPLIMVYGEKPTHSIKKEIINALLAIQDEHSLAKLMDIASDTTEDLYIRLLIIRDIGKFDLNDSPEVVNAAVKLLQDENKEVKKRALDLVTSYKLQNIQNYLLPLIKDPDKDIRMKAIKYLYSMEGERLVSKLVSILSSDEVKDDVKERVVEVLGIVHSGQIRELLKKLTRCNIENIRKNALISLAHSNDVSIVEIVTERLADNSAKVRKAALSALSKLNAQGVLNKIIPLIMDNDDAVREEAVFVISTLVKPHELKQLEPLMKNPNINVIKSVLKIFSNKEYFPESFYSLLDSFIKLKDKEINASVVDILTVNKDGKSYLNLLGIYKRVDEDLKVEILYSLKKFENLLPDMAEPLFDFYKDEKSPKLRSILTDIIALAKTKDSGQMLLFIINQEDDARTKSNAIEALEQYFDTIDEIEIVNTVMPTLRDDNNRVKANAAKTLWELGGLRMLAKLEDMLKEADKWQRASACFVLGEIGAIQVVPILKKALKDHEDVVRANAIKALGKCGETSMFQQFLDIFNGETQNVKKAILFTLRYSNDELFMDFLVSMLENVDDDIAVEAARSFNVLLIENNDLILRVSDNIENLSKAVLKELIDGFGDVYNKTSLEILEQLSYDDDVDISSKALSLYKKVEQNCLKNAYL